jgi:hypothetical protein
MRLMATVRRVAPYVDAAQEAIVQKSWKKATAVVLAGLIAIFGDQIGLDGQQVKVIAEAIMAYVIGQGMADFGKNRAN